MATVDDGLIFGQELRDSFKSVNAWVAHGIQWIDDLRQFYTERSQIEREYAEKLQALSNRFFDKKGRKATLLSVGDSPSVTPGSLESASMVAWSAMLQVVEKNAKHHAILAKALSESVAIPLDQFRSKLENLRAAHVKYADSLEKERDASYAALRQTKGKYDAICQDVEQKRKRNEGSGKSLLAFNQYKAEMNNVKNTYIIAIEYTNSQKHLYYNKHVPELLNSMEELNRTKVDKLNSYWMLSLQIERTCLDDSLDTIDHVIKHEIPKNSPKYDSMMYATHNKPTNSNPIPNDFAFEPCSIYYDDDKIIVDEAATNFLRNLLLRSKTQFLDCKQKIDGKRREVESLRKAQRDINDGKDDRDVVKVMELRFDMERELREIERQVTAADVEISTITAAVGDVSIGARDHNFKAETFKLPTNCDHCGDRMWGLTAKGFTCRDCGFDCHSKCKMKIPTDCPGELTKEDKKSTKAQRQETSKLARDIAENMALANGHESSPIPSRSATISSSRAPPQRSDSSAIPSAIHSTDAHNPPVKPRNRILAPPPAITRSDEDDGEIDIGKKMPKKLRCKVLYDFTASNSKDEKTVFEGQELDVVEEEESGWITVRDSHGKGIVPASYVRVFAADSSASPSTYNGGNRPGSSYSASSQTATGSTSSAAAAAAAPVKKKGPAVAPRRGGGKKRVYVRALYDYEAQTIQEQSMIAGNQFLLLLRDDGNGWSEVESNNGERKSVPANYVKEV